MKMSELYSPPNEVICTSGRPGADAPDTPLLKLAAERGWSVFSYADDGAGEVEIAPGISLVIKNDKFDDWTVSVTLHAARRPGTVRDLDTGLPKALQVVATLILGAAEEEIAEVRRQGPDA
jgi:hypothetical protein